jgi:hypothetical protein
MNVKILNVKQRYLGRFGNFLGGLMNVFWFAYLQDFHIITFETPSFNVYGYKPIKLGKYCLRGSNQVNDGEVHSMFSNGRDILSLYNPFRYTNILPYYELREMGHKYVCNIMDLNIHENKTCDDFTLVMHMRSEDIFEGHEMVDLYVQPPFAFYKDILQSNEQFKHIVIVSSPDFNNPCIPLIKTLCQNLDLRLTLVSKSVKDDFETLANCQNLVISTSTFSLYASMLSKQLERLFVFKTPNFYHNIPTLNHIKTTFYDGGDTYLKTFHNLPGEVEIIKTFDISKLKQY